MPFILQLSGTNMMVIVKMTEIHLQEGIICLITYTLGIVTLLNNTKGRNSLTMGTSTKKSMNSRTGRNINLSLDLTVFKCPADIF